MFFPGVRLDYGLSNEGYVGVAFYVLQGVKGNVAVLGLYEVKVEYVVASFLEHLSVLVYQPALCDSDDKAGIICIQKPWVNY